MNSGGLVEVPEHVSPWIFLHHLRLNGQLNILMCTADGGFSNMLGSVCKGKRSFMSLKSYCSEQELWDRLV